MYLTLPDVRSLARENPKTTAWMEMRALEAAAAGRPQRREFRWVPYSRISSNLKRAVIVTEDSKFWDHEGVDLEQIKESIEVNVEKMKAMRGGSTVTQQLAKNLYLSPSRNPIRKLRELILARRLEATLSKARILELYLNVIEWGDGVWGAEAAARRYFGVSASALTAPQSALLAGAIRNPHIMNPGRPSGRLLRLQARILRNMNYVEPPAAVPVVMETPVDSAAPPALTEPVPPEPAPPPPVKPPTPCPVPPCTP